METSAEHYWTRWLRIIEGVNTILLESNSCQNRITAIIKVGNNLCYAKVLGKLHVDLLILSIYQQNASVWRQSTLKRLIKYIKRTVMTIGWPVENLWRYYAKRMYSYFVMPFWHLKTDVSTVHSILQFLRDYLQICIRLIKEYKHSQ